VKSNQQQDPNAATTCVCTDCAVRAVDWASIPYQRAIFGTPSETVDNSGPSALDKQCAVKEIWLSNTQPIPGLCCGECESSEVIWTDPTKRASLSDELSSMTWSMIHSEDVLSNGWVTDP
jgi:hypothetical protein